MKFKNPKNGIIYEDSSYALADFIKNSCHYPCYKCMTFTTARCNINWVENNPIEAAFLMGYEIVGEFS